MNQTLERDEHMESKYARDLRDDYPHAPQQAIEKAAAELVSIDRMNRRGHLTPGEFGLRRDAVLRDVARAHEKNAPQLRRRAAGTLRR